MRLGTRLGSYEIIELVGSGGMGEVYRARDTRLNRTVAIKILPVDRCDASARARFRREAEIASSLNHPNVLTVHDVGEAEGSDYLVTELVEGGTFADWMRAGARTWHEVVSLLVGVADGLATAHEAGILHRDVKPANILIHRSGFAKLGDFGLAKHTDSVISSITETRSADHTTPGLIVGTVAYMSPEQALGRPIDARSDVFAFGIVLYEAIAGRRPHEGPTALDILRAITDTPAPPLSDAVPAPLRAVVAKCLEKDPAKRFQSMGELVEALRQLQPPSGVVVPPAAGLRHRTLWLAAGAMGAAAIAAALWLRSPTASTTPTAPELVNPLSNATFTRLTIPW